MPCRDWGPPGQEYDQGPSLKVRNDQLALEACELRALVLDLSSRIKNLDLATQKKIKKIHKKQEKHRQGDKEAAIVEIQREIRSIEQDIKNIKKLGGIPAPRKLKKIQKLKDKELDVLNSDPMNTDLY